MSTRKPPHIQDHNHPAHLLPAAAAEDGAQARAQAQAIAGLSAELFTPAGNAERRAAAAHIPPRRPARRRPPYFSFLCLFLLTAGALAAPYLARRDPRDFFLTAMNTPPGAEFFFGTDPLGRDLFSLIWFALQSSLWVGLTAALLAALAAICIGSLSALAPDRLDRLLQRLLEICQGIPQILLLMVLCCIFDGHSRTTLGLIIGSCSFFALARLVRTEVRQQAAADYITAARGLGSGTAAVICRHLLPNVMPSLIFAFTANLSRAVAAEALLSFLGLGLPADILSLGGMLSLSQRAFLMHNWWSVVIPAVFLLLLMGSVTAAGAWLQQRSRPQCSYL